MRGPELEESWDDDYFDLDEADYIHRPSSLLDPLDDELEEDDEQYLSQDEFFDDF